MTKRLLIDASHAEETRVVVLDGNRLEDFDVETQSRRQLKGNIYLAKVVRVEPSLQAAFVEYGGNRHGFLAFGEIHPDYYQIPVADRQRLIEMQEEEARAEQEEDDAFGDADAPAQAIEIYIEQAGVDDAGNDQAENDQAENDQAYNNQVGNDQAGNDQAGNDQAGNDRAGQAGEPSAETVGQEPDDARHLADEVEPAEAQPLSIAQNSIQGELLDQVPAAPIVESIEAEALDDRLEGVDTAPEAAEPATPSGADEAATPTNVGDTPPTSDQNEMDLADTGTRVRQIEADEQRAPEMLGGELDHAEETRTPRQPSRYLRSYKIQEVIRRRQILLIQVVKEERGTKGAALTTYISLAGRYCVLMPNSPRGGGISRKITSAADRRRLKEVTAELDIPRGMGLIVRTAGAARPKPEIKRDGEYLLRLWDDIREQTMRSMAPALIHEEASLIKRAIRDVYSRDVDELVVDGEEGWRAARDYMRMLMPAHVKKVQLWPTNGQPLFAQAQVESMLDAMLNPVVQLRSGGYLVINQTEALVAIDVNSGRSTRERGIEETALRTNLEAAEEAARQLRLRDLAGLIVIDFIDMESKKHNAMVERRMADALKNDRARIQIGHISHFGLLELSRQRLRPSLAETSLNVCAHCGGAGHVRSTESAALHVLREIEEEGGRRRAAEILVYVAGATALFILNNKRHRLSEIEQRYAMRVCFASDETLLPAQTRIDRLRAAVPQDLLPPPVTQAYKAEGDDLTEAEETDDEDVVIEQPEPATAAAASTGDFTSDADHVPGETEAEGEQRRRRRRRRRRGGRREDGAAADAVGDAGQPTMEGAEQPDIPDRQFPAQPALPVPGHDEAAEAMAEAQLPQQNAGIPETPESASEGDTARPKRGRRGGRRRRKPGEEAEAAVPDAEIAQESAQMAPVYVPPAYTPYVGPTPADPFALGGMDIFDALEQAEQRKEAFVVAEAPQPPAEMDNQQPSEPDSEASVVAEPPQPPVVQPILVGEAPAQATARKGWWRR